MEAAVLVYGAKLALTKLRVELPKKECGTEYLARAKYYPLFQNSERGKRLADIFDKGILALCRSGKLESFFRNAGNVASVENMDSALANADMP